MLTDLEMSPKDLNAYFGQTVRLTSSARPLQRTDILSIYLDDIKGAYHSIRDKVSKAHAATITSSKIRWFSMLDPDRVLELKQQLVQ